MTVDLNLILQVATLATVVGGGIFAVMEVGRARRARSDEGARDVIEEQRKEKNLPNIAEWFQWLVEQLEKYGRREKAVGTHIAFKEWKP